MNLVKHMSSNTTDRACLAYTRQSAFDKRQSLPRVSYTSTMKQIMGCYHLHIERKQTVRKNSSVGNEYIPVFFTGFLAQKVHADVLSR